MVESTNIVNVQMAFPVQNVTLISPDGRQVFTKQLGGTTGTVQLTIPPISKGFYFMTFYGNGWKTTQKIVVGR